MTGIGVCGDLTEREVQGWLLRRRARGAPCPGERPAAARDAVGRECDAVDSQHCRGGVEDLPGVAPSILEGDRWRQSFAFRVEDRVHVKEALGVAAVARHVSRCGRGHRRRRVLLGDNLGVVLDIPLASVARSCSSGRWPPCPLFVACLWCFVGHPRSSTPAISLSGVGSHVGSGVARSLCRSRGTMSGRFVRAPPRMRRPAMACEFTVQPPLWRRDRGENCARGTLPSPLRCPRRLALTASRLPRGRVSPRKATFPGGRRRRSSHRQRRSRSASAPAWAPRTSLSRGPWASRLVGYGALGQCEGR